MDIFSFLKTSGIIRADKKSKIPPEDKKQKVQRIIEITVLLLLGTASITSAWCVFEATAWGNVQMESVGAIALLQAESIRLTDNDNSLRTIDVNLFLSWLQAASDNATQRKIFLQKHFRDEFKPAFNEWLNSAKPGEIPDGTPFSLNSYELETTKELAQIKMNMSDKMDITRQANENSDNYVLSTVFGALVLFFAGIAGKWKWPIITLIFILLAIVFQIIVFQRIFTLPVINW